MRSHLKTVLRRRLDPRTYDALLYLAAKLRLRVRERAGVPDSQLLHFGCGPRRAAGWLNVDLTRSDWDVDLTKRLPWPDGHFRAAVGQHTIEHFHLDEGRILLAELYRVLGDKGELWLSCPDLTKLCSAYVQGEAEAIEAEVHQRQGVRQDRTLAEMFNDIAFQGGQHKVLFDFDMLSQTLKDAGFSTCTEEDEAAFLNRFPEFPKRNDDTIALYVRATLSRDFTDR